MGINDINILIQPDISYQEQRATEIAQKIQAELVAAHNRGEHPFGLMDKRCPLCQQGNF